MNIRGLREMNVQFPAQTVRATVIGAGAHTLSLSGSTIWLEGVALPLRNSPWRFRLMRLIWWLPGSRR
jgi:ethanolamine utilization protein EutA (predicted chaperonin)